MDRAGPRQRERARHDVVAAVGEAANRIAVVRSPVAVVMIAGVAANVIGEFAVRSAVAVVTAPADAAKRIAVVSEPVAVQELDAAAANGIAVVNAPVAATRLAADEAKRIAVVSEPVAVDTPAADVAKRIAVVSAPVAVVTAAEDVANCIAVESAPVAAVTAVDDAAKRIAVVSAPVAAVTIEAAVASAAGPSGKNQSVNILAAAVSVLASRDVTFRGKFVGYPRRRFRRNGSALLNGNRPLFVCLFVTYISAVSLAVTPTELVASTRYAAPLLAVVIVRPRDELTSPGTSAHVPAGSVRICH